MRKRFPAFFVAEAALSDRFRYRSINGQRKTSVQEFVPCLRDECVAFHAPFNRRFLSVILQRSANVVAALRRSGKSRAARAFYCTSTMAVMPLAHRSLYAIVFSAAPQHARATCAAFASRIAPTRRLLLLFPVSPSLHASCFSKIPANSACVAAQKTETIGRHRRAGRMK